MKKTQLASLYPMSKGLDTTSIPGSQEPRALTVAQNIILRTRPSIKKRPGIVRERYAGQDGGVQNAIQWYSTSGGAQVEETVRVRKGRIEVLRDTAGGDPQFYDLGHFVDDSDVVTFERYANILIVHFENSQPVYLTPGAASVTNLPILASHVASPPAFSRAHDYRLFYSGRAASPHRIWVSAINDPFNYALGDGGFSMRVRDGDGDPKGITAISPAFRGDLYVFKWNSIYRIYRSAYDYGVDQVTDEVGCVHHNAVAMGQNDIWFVSSYGIHSLAVTDKYGAAESTTLTYPIYEYFIRNVNWNNAKNMKLAYDKPTGTLLLAYTSAGSMVNDRVLGYNVQTKEFFEWRDCPYRAVMRYFQWGKQKTAVESEDDGLCVLDDESNTINGRPISMRVETGNIFPLQNPKVRVCFTQGWLLVRPTTKSVTATVGWALNGGEETTQDVDLNAGGYGSLINAGQLGGVIGTDIIGSQHDDLAVIPFDLQGEANCVRFSVAQTPPDSDPDQACEIYGIVYEFSYDEDSTQKQEI